MGIFDFFSQKHDFLGCDIGTTSIKIVELKKKGEFAHLHNYALLETLGHFERSNNVIQANALKISEKETTKLLSLLLQKGKFSTSYAVASIPSFSSFTVLLEIPLMDESETQKAMPFQIKQHIPLPLSEIAVDWMRVGQREDEDGFNKQYILLIAIPHSVIESYKTIFKNAGLKLKALEVETLAYTRSLVGSDQTTTGIIDIGARSTNISIVDQGFLKHNTQIDYAGDSLTTAIAKGLGIQSRRAEELKKQKGILGGTGEYELSTLQKPFLDAILKEVEKVKKDFEGSFHTPVQRFLLVGGGANLVGIVPYTEEKLGIPVVLGNGFLYVTTPPELSALLPELQTRFSLATGLAIRGLM